MKRIAPKLAAVLLGSLLTSQTATAGNSSLALHTPKWGSQERTDILDALRRHLQINSKFKVYHLKTAGEWAYLHGGEIVPLDDQEWQETDLCIEALLHRIPSKQWIVTEIWTLPGNDKYPHDAFDKQVQHLRQTHHIDPGIFP